MHDVIYRELCVGVIRDASREEYRRIMRGLADRGVEAILFGCTEIDLLVGPDDSPVPCSTPPGFTHSAPSTSRSTRRSHPRTQTFELGPRRSQRLPAMSRKMATRPYGSSRGSPTNSTPAWRIRSIGTLEVVDAQEQPDTAGELVADGSFLAIAVGTCKQQSRRGARRPHDDPALGPPTCGGQGRRVLDQLEAEDVDEEPDGSVVVVDDQRYVLDVHPREITTTSGRIRNRRRGEGSRRRPAKLIRCPVWPGSSTS